jgi:hypothetical protein
MKALAISLIILGAAGCGIAILSALGGVEFEAFGHSFGITLTVDWRALVVSVPLFLGGIALWFFAVRPRRGDGQQPGP